MTVSLVQCPELGLQASAGGTLDRPDRTQPGCGRADAGLACVGALIVGLHRVVGVDGLCKGFGVEPYSRRV